MYILISAKTYITKREKGKTPSALIYPVVICSKTKLCCGYFFFLGPLPRSFFSILFEQECFKKGKSDWRKNKVFVLVSQLLTPVNVNNKIKTLNM